MADKDKRLDMLVRQGLLPANQLPMLHRALNKIEAGQNLVGKEKEIFGRFTNEIMSIVFGDATTFQRAKMHTQRNKYRTEENIVEEPVKKKVDGVEIVDGEEARMKDEKAAKKLGRQPKDKKMKLMPKAVRKEKEKAGVSEDLLKFNEDYKEKFAAGLKKFGVSNIRDLNPEQKKKFFNYMDTQHKAKNEGKEYLETDMKKRQKNNEKAREDMKKMGKPMKNPALGEEKDKPPFDGPYKKAKGTITDKSGAKHTEMSRARDLAQKGLKTLKKEEADFIEKIAQTLGYEIADLTEEQVKIYNKIFKKGEQ